MLGVIMSVYLDLLRIFQKIILIHWKKCSYYTQTTDILLAAALHKSKTGNPLCFLKDPSLITANCPD